MARFVHFTDSKNKASIIRNGIKAGRYGDLGRGVFAMPVIPCFQSSHQWLREIKSCHAAGSVVAVYFQIKDDEAVFFGHYNDCNSELAQTTAAKAHEAFYRAENRMGHQVFLPRSVPASGVSRIKDLGQTVGWRHMPGAHGKKFCLCPACLQRGAYKAMKTREKELTGLFRTLRAARDTDEKSRALEAIADASFLFAPVARLLHADEAALLLDCVEFGDPQMKCLAISLLSMIFGGRFLDLYRDVFHATDDIDVADACMVAMYCSGAVDLDLLDSDKLELIEEYRQ